MGSVLQKKKRRSGRAKVKTNRPKKLLNPLGNDIIAKNWYADIHTLAAPSNSRPSTLSSRYREKKS